MPTRNKNMINNIKLNEHDELGNRLISAAREIVCENGFQALTARSLCGRAGCSLGAIYTRFTDMDEVLFYMNALVFKELSNQVYQECLDDMSAKERLDKLVEIYRNFSEEQSNLWSTVFNREISKNQTFPKWYLESMSWFFEFMENIVKDLYPHMNFVEIKKLTRTAFAAVHGITVMSSRRAFVSISDFDVKESTDFILEKLFFHKK